MRRQERVAGGRVRFVDKLCGERFDGQRFGGLLRIDINGKRQNDNEKQSGEHTDRHTLVDSP
jgi:hypothetical protein